MNDTERDALFSRLVAPFDLHDEAGRREAYQKCLTYTQEEMGFTFDANTFLRFAAKKLDVMPAVLQVVRAQVEMPENARLLLTYDEQAGPELLGNPEGLRYLGELCRVLSTATSEFEHIHLYQNEPPLLVNSFGLTICHETDVWFDKRAEEEAIAEIAPSGNESDRPPRREIDPASVIALGLFGSSPFPPFLLLTAGRLYRVHKQAAYKNQKATVEFLSDAEDKTRMVVWTLRNDVNKTVRVAFDLDDPDVRFFTAPDLQQI